MKNFIFILGISFVTLTANAATLTKNLKECNRTDVSKNRRVTKISEEENTPLIRNCPATIVYGGRLDLIFHLVASNSFECEYKPIVSPQELQIDGIGQWIECDKAIPSP